MPTFEIRGKDGKTYQVKAADQNAALASIGNYQAKQRESDYLGKQLGKMDFDEFGHYEDTQPGYQRPEPTAGNLKAVRDRLGAQTSLLNGVTFGFGDELKALAASGDYDENQKLHSSIQRGFAKDNPATALALELSGGLASGGAVGALAKQAAKKAAPKALAQFDKLSPVKKVMATGGAYGAAYGAGSAEPDSRLVGAAKGLGAGALGGGIVQGGVISPISRAISHKKYPGITGLDVLRLKKDAAYKAAEEGGEGYKMSALEEIHARSKNYLAEEGFHPKAQKGAKRYLKHIQEQMDSGSAGVTPKGMEQIRKFGKNQYSALNKPNNRMVKGMERILDDVVDNGAHAFNGVGSSFKEARELNRRYSILSDLADEVDRKTRAAAVAGTGGNLINQQRQAINNLINKDKFGRLAPHEMELAERVVYGTPGVNAARLAGAISPERGGLAMLANLGAVAADPAFLAASATGFLGKRIGERGTKNAIKALEDALLNGRVIPKIKPVTGIAPVTGLLGARAVNQ